MQELNENHKRRIAVTFQHIDKLLTQSLRALSQSHSGSQQSAAGDLAPDKIQRIVNHIEMLRKQMKSILDRLDIALPEPTTLLSWMLRTNLTSVDMALEDLYPSKMRGYGAMGTKAASELTDAVQAIRNQLSLVVNELDRD